MKFEKAIESCYGIVFREVPADGKMRSFNIGKKEGFAMLFADCGVFGCWQDCLAYEWHGPLSTLKELHLSAPKRKPLYGKALEFQRQIVLIGNAAQDRGEPLTGEDELKYINALVKCIEASNG